MARHLNGVFGWLNSLTSPGLSYPVSFQLRFKTTDAGGGIGIAYGEAYPGWNAYYSHFSTTGITCSEAQGSSFPSGTVTGTPTDDQWHHAVWVYASNTNRRVYLDSVANVAADLTAVGFADHPDKNFTLGGALLNVDSLHSATIIGDYADAAIWDTALTPDDVAALFAGRPGTVKPANLKGWWKLGEDGDLSSSVGSYPAMTVYGTTSVSDDPPYAGGAPGTLKTINAVPMASVKSFLNIPKASIKTINALTIGGAAEPEFSPADIAGLQAWYKADEGVYSQSAAQFVVANDESLTSPSNTSLRFGNIPWTIGCWFYQDTLAGGQVLICKNGVATIEYMLYIDSTDINLLATPPISTRALIPTPAAGAWHFVIGSFDTAGGGVLSLQLDNGTIANSAATGALDDGTETFKLGSDGAASRMDGRLQNCFLFGRALNATERTFLYNAGAGRSYEELDSAFKTDLRAWWPLDETSGSRRDLSGNNNTLTDNNTVGEADGLVLNPAGNGGRVYEWKDQGLLGLHVSQDTLSNRPIYQTNVKNGQPAIIFNEALHLKVASVPLAGLPIAVSDGSTWVVLEGNDTGVVVLGWSGTGAYLIARAGGNWIYDHGNPGNFDGRIYGAGAATWCVVEGYRSSGGNVQEIRRNDTTLGTMAPLSSLAGGPVDFFIGGSGSTWQGPVGEVAIYNVALSAGDRAALRDYFNAKYALGF